MIIFAGIYAPKKRKRCFFLFPWLHSQTVFTQGDLDRDTFDVRLENYTVLFEAEPSIAVANRYLADILDIKWLDFVAGIAGFDRLRTGSSNVLAQRLDHEITPDAGRQSSTRDAIER